MIFELTSESSYIKLISILFKEKRGPTVIGLQSQLDLGSLVANIPKLADMPIIPIHVMDSDNLYSQLEWQKIGARTMFRFIYPLFSFL